MLLAEILKEPPRLPLSGQIYFSFLMCIVLILQDLMTMKVDWL